MQVPAIVKSVNQAALSPLSPDELAQFHGYLRRILEAMPSTMHPDICLPDGLRYPESTPAVEQCLASERADALIRAQAAEATKSGVNATPSLRLLDRQTGQAILLQGPIEGDALLSAMDMLAAEGPTSTPTSEMPADVVGDMPR